MIALPPVCSSFWTFQSSPSPEAGCNSVEAQVMAELEGVSILTQPGGRVQSDPVGFVETALGFQSSPSPEAGCNLCLASYPLIIPMFQSSPSPEAGCNLNPPPPPPG